MRQRGFTLLEMLVVVAILGFLVALIVERGPPHSAGLNARMAANDVAGLLRAARSQAIAADRPVTVVVDPAARVVLVGGGRPHQVSASLVPPARPIVFAPDGSSGGGEIGVTDGTVRKSVTVDWLTGRVSVVSVD